MNKIGVRLNIDVTKLQKENETAEKESKPLVIKEK